MVYSLLSMTDGNGIVCYERPYDGSTSDQEMDCGVIEFMSEKVESFETCWWLIVRSPLAR